MAPQNVILVTGATGKVGREVVSGLLDTGATVRALVRDPASAGLPAGVEVVRGDLSAPDTVAAALDGVGAVFLLWPFLTAEHAPPVIDAIARQAGRIVYLSSIGVRDDLEEQTDAINTFHAGVERLIEKSTLAWTFVRPGGFASNVLGWAAGIRAEGVVRAPFGDMARPLIHERDIAAVAVRALTEDGHGSAKYQLTGPALVTQTEQVAAIGAAIDRPVRFEEQSREDARAGMVQAWGDATVVDQVLDAWASLSANPEPITDTVERVLGRPALTFADWAVDHAEDFR
ncbi:NAD(P)H-binding protein [Solihabitans fulvus]|uniref:NAD(P)H-binding protein n=1 Tax=Solihabitans fulvus TaxID=1892852 RepID=A0A5B2X4H2_9PSEU|nr:NAD(P)H-binding protein [Solihabitans fulvus]KAA2258093.1 NAD(P)H-binding protein [Solihabitans fulvus]